MFNLEAIENLTIQRYSMDELIVLHSQVESMKASYDKFQVNTPDFVEEAHKLLSRAIRDKNQESIDLRKTQIKRKLDSLKTPAEKRSELEAELASLNA